MGDTQRRRSSAVKTTVTLPADILEDVKTHASEQGVTVSDVLRRAADLALYLDGATKQGDRVLLENREKQLRELVILR